MMKMNPRRRFALRASAVAVAACFPFFAHAGGPLGVCNNAPLKYPGAGTITLNYSSTGVLGSRSKAASDALVTNAVSLWTNVSTATVSLNRGNDLAPGATFSSVGEALHATSAIVTIDPARMLCIQFLMIDPFVKVAAG